MHQHIRFLINLKQITAIENGKEGKIPFPVNEWHKVTQIRMANLVTYETNVTRQQNLLRGSYILPTKPKVKCCRKHDYNVRINGI